MRALSASPPPSTDLAVEKHCVRNHSRALLVARTLTAPPIRHGYPHLAFRPSVPTPGNSGRKVALLQRSKFDPLCGLGQSIYAR